MQIKEAIVKRIKNICLERGIKYNELATRSGVTPLKKLCDGLDMTITEFFDDDIFKTLEQEIQ